MLPLEALTPEETRDLRGLLFDLDDTFLEHGLLTQEALAALSLLKESGLELIALTGRPIAWAQTLAHVLPVSGAIGENGSVAFFREGRRVVLRDSVHPSVRAERRERLHALVRCVRNEVPALVPADDSGARVSDFTFDIGEHERAHEEDIERATQIAREAGARVTRSSVHLHLTWDRLDKASGAVRFLTERGHDSTEILRSFAFIGDSENDAPCFAAFRTTIGVRNLRGRFHLLPRFQTKLAQSHGFFEAARRISTARSVIPPLSPPS